MRETGEYETLDALAREEAFLQAQTEQLADAPEAPLRTLQTALQGAIDQDEAAGMAEFSLRHPRRKQPVTQESPLAALRTCNLERAWGLAELMENQRCVLWHLLLAWELEDAGKIEGARATLERLVPREFPRLSDWMGEHAVFLLGQVTILQDNDLAFLCQRLLEGGTAWLAWCRQLESVRKMNYP